MLTFTAFYFYSRIYNYLYLLSYWKPSKHCSYKQEAHMSLYCSTGKEDFLNKLAIEHVIILISLSQRLKPKIPWFIYWYRTVSSYHNSASF